MLDSKGALLEVFLREVDEVVSQLAVVPELAYQTSALKWRRGEWVALTRDLAQRVAARAGRREQNTARDGDEAGGAACDSLMYAGYVALACFWARSSLVAQQQLGKGAESEAFYRSKLQTTRFYFERTLPRTRSLATTFKAPASAPLQIAERRLFF